MRKILFTLAISAILLAMSCETEPEEPNPFVGTWETTHRDDVHLIFTPTIVTSYYDYGYDKIYWSGTYSYDNDKLTIVYNHELTSPLLLETYGNIFIFEKYVFEGDLLHLYEPALNTYKKIN